MTILRFPKCSSSSPSGIFTFSVYHLFHLLRVCSGFLCVCSVLHIFLVQIFTYNISIFFGRFLILSIAVEYGQNFNFRICLNRSVWRILLLEAIVLLYYSI